MAARRDDLPDLAPCTYCGLPAESVDHVIPRNHRRAALAVGARWNARVADTVPACCECNQLASALVFRGVVEKRSYIHQRLRARYSWALKTANWSEEELDELGPTLRSSVDAAIAAKRLIHRRLRWPAA
jgi:5-methylcytosine-specific restriction endonuclease McrA